MKTFAMITVAAVLAAGCSGGEPPTVDEVKVEPTPEATAAESTPVDATDAVVEQPVTDTLTEVTVQGQTVD